MFLFIYFTESFIYHSFDSLSRACHIDAHLYKLLIAD